MDDLAVITSYFNFTGNKRFLWNFKKFEESLSQQGVPLFAIEISRGGFELPENPNYFKFKTNSLLWHKESSLNALVKKLPPEIKKIAWIDSDIIIRDEDWAKKTCSLLEENKMVQIIGHCDFLYQDGQIAFSQETLGRAFIEKRENYNRIDIHHLGLGWAVNRDFFDEVGLFDMDMVGGGDSVTYFSGMGNVEDLHPWKKRIIEKNCPELWSEISSYNKKCFEYTKGKISCSDANAIHLFHSFYENRNYIERYEALLGFELKDIKRQENGLFEWNNKKNIEAKVEEYF
ncbi:MAG: hypothetical protein QF380_06950, partial [Candidatus Marinimicrobia bacterium]|nr:hypothetical protein [Candidatus Neomarinimicrobiota bacterium]